MYKNPMVASLNKKQQRAMKWSGKIIGLFVRTVGSSKRSIRFVACSARFLACNNYDVADNLGVVHRNNPFPQCKEYSCRGKVFI